MKRLLSGGSQMHAPARIITNDLEIREEEIILLRFSLVCSSFLPYMSTARGDNFQIVDVYWWKRGHSGEICHKRRSYWLRQCIFNDIRLIIPLPREIFNTWHCDALRPSWGLSTSGVVENNATHLKVKMNKPECKTRMAFYCCLNSIYCLTIFNRYFSISSVICYF